MRGCYLHGLFGSDDYRRALLSQSGFEPVGNASHAQGVQNALDELAAEMERYVDIEGLLLTAR